MSSCAGSPPTTSPYGSWYSSTAAYRRGMSNTGYIILNVLTFKDFSILINLNRCYLSLVTGSPSADLPEDETEAVDVCSFEALEAVGVDVVAEDLWGHVTSGAYPGVWGDVQRLRVAVVPHRQTKVCYGCCPVIFDEDI